MSKKYAFSVVQKSQKRTARSREFSYTNVMFVAGSF